MTTTMTTKMMTKPTPLSMNNVCLVCVSLSICSSCATGSKRYSALRIRWYFSIKHIRSLLPNRISIVYSAAYVCESRRRPMLSPISSTLLRSTSRRCCSPASTSSSHYCRLQLSMRSRPRSGARRTRRSSRSSPASSRRSRRRRSASRMLCSVRLTTRNALVMFDDHTVSGWKSSCCVFDRYRFRCRF